MDQRAVVVVGAAGGIGSAIARRAARDGFSPLILMDRDAEALNDIAVELEAHAVPVDVTDRAAVAHAFAKARTISKQLYGLVLASGVVDNGRLADLDPERFDDILRINLTGPFLCCREARDWLMNGGRIVTVGSLAGRTGGVITGTAYAASKGGIEALTKSMAQELAPRKITVNCIAPGAVETAMLAAHTPERKAEMSAATPLKRMARPEEIAAAAAYLLDADAAFTTGAVIAVNGGLRMD